jgi:hypothetical protein
MPMININDLTIGKEVDKLTSTLRKCSNNMALTTGALGVY